MKFVYSPETRLAPTFADIKEATAFLAEKVLGPKRGETVTAAWTRVLTPREETLDRLTLRDEPAEVFAGIPVGLTITVVRIWPPLWAGAQTLRATEF